MTLNKDITKIARCVWALVVVFFCSHCANPVPPLGGDKDTAQPILINVSNKIENNLQQIKIEFSENIQTKNALIVSPILKESLAKTITTTYPRNIKISTPQTTNTIYLNGFVYDLNENNPINHPTFLLKDDTGELVVALPLEDVKIKKIVFIRDANRYNLQAKQTDSSLIYLPHTADNRTYHFHGLTDSLHIVYVIYEDNDYIISNYEKANCFYITNNYRDTIKIITTSKSKNYKSAFNYQDSLYLITEPTLSMAYFNMGIIHYFNKDTVVVSNEHVGILRKALSIDSFSSIKKINGTYNDKNNYYTIINLVDTTPVRLFHQYPLINDNKKTNNTLSDSIDPLIKAGRINIINPNTFTTNISITIGSSEFFLSLKANSTESFYLPEGGYSYICWVPNSYSTFLLSPHEIDYQKQIPVTDPEYIYKPIKPLVVSLKLENTLILPDITSFNTGIISK